MQNNKRALLAYLHYLAPFHSILFLFDLFFLSKWLTRKAGKIALTHAFKRTNESNSPHYFKARFKAFIENSIDLTFHHINSPETRQYRNNAKSGLKYWSIYKYNPLMYEGWVVFQGSTYFLNFVFSDLHVSEIFLFTYAHGVRLVTFIDTFSFSVIAHHTSPLQRYILYTLNKHFHSNRRRKMREISFWREWISSLSGFLVE